MLHIYIYDISHLRVNVPIVMKSGTLKLLEPSGSVQACNGIAFTIIHQNLKCLAAGSVVWAVSFVNSQTVCMAAGSARLAAIPVPVCCKLNAHVLLFQRTAVYDKLLLAILKEGAANGFLQPADTCHT